MTTAVIGTTASNPHHDPSASGMPTSMMMAPIYIGCRTSAYGPVVMIVWPGATSMVPDVYVFALNTRNTMKKPRAMRMSPAATT